MLAVVSVLQHDCSAQDLSKLRTGSLIDDFTLHDQQGSERKLSDLLAESPIALVVNRSAGWCSHSKDQLIGLQKELESIERTGLKVVALSYDEQPALKNFATAKKIQFPLLADPGSKVIRKLGLVNTTRKKGTLRYGVAHPLTIIINQDRSVAGILQGAVTELHNAQQLIEAWNKNQPEEFKNRKKLSLIKVHGNKFVDANGKTVLFKGIAIADPHKIANDGKWSRAHFEEIKKWGPNLIRIPVHPGFLRKRGFKNYVKMLDEAVRWCGELEMHVSIDWHSIGNLKDQKFEAAKYHTSLKETQKFWEAISKRYANNPTVAFYEVFNEPSVSNGTLGECTWEQWKAMVETIIDVIRANDEEVIALVGGFDWSYDLRDIKDNPIDRPNVAYTAHPYPGKCQPPREPHWEEHFGFLADRYPIIASEMSFYVRGEFEYMNDNDGSYRKSILKYLDKKNISWCAWVFDPDWAAPLVKSYDYEPTATGLFFRKAMLGK